MEKEASQNGSRRKFLKTAGKFAIYTPPALMLMSKSSHAYMTKTNGIPKRKKKLYKRYKGDRKKIFRIVRRRRRYYRKRDS